MLEYDELNHVFGLEPAYRRFNASVIAEQARFERTGKYNPQNLDPCWERETYFPGLLASWYQWPHQAALVAWFREHYLPLVRDEYFYDVGFGTGLFSRLALQEGHSHIRGIGYDLSEEAVQFAQRHLRHFGLDSRYAYRLQDVREINPHPLGSLICAEVIEHVADPVSLLKALRKMSSGKAFITTALNAPNRDHVYLYREVDEVAAHLREAGFRFKFAFESKAETGPASVVGFICE